MLQGTAPALAVSQLAQFGIRAGQSSEAVGASFEAEYAAAADAVLNGTGREAFEAIKMLKTADPSKYQPANGADYPRSAFGDSRCRQIAQLIKADVGLEIAFADVGGWDTHVQPGRGARDSSPPASTTSRTASRRSSPTSATAWPTRRADDVGVRARRAAKTATAAPTTATATR